MKWRFVHLSRLMCHQDGRPHVQSRHPSAAGRGRQSQPGTSGPSWWGAAELIWPRGSSWRSSGRAGRLVWTRLRQRKKEEEESCLISWGPQCGGPVVRAGGSAATWCDCCSPPSCSYVPGFIHWSLKRIFLQLVVVNDPTQITPVANQKVGGSIPTSRIVLMMIPRRKQQIRRTASCAAGGFYVFQVPNFRTRLWKRSGAARAPVLDSLLPHLQMFLLHQQNNIFVGKRWMSLFVLIYLKVLCLHPQGCRLCRTSTPPGFTGLVMFYHRFTGRSSCWLTGAHGDVQGNPAVLITTLWLAVLVTWGSNCQSC